MPDAAPGSTPAGSTPAGSNPAGSTPTRSTVAVVAAMPLELKPVIRRLGLRPDPAGGRAMHRGTVDGLAVVAAVTGIGTEKAAAATEAVLDRAGSAAHLVVVGVAGGVDPALRIADVVVPAVALDGASGISYTPTPVGDTKPAGTLHTSDELVVDDGAVEALRRRGVIALDMETAAMAAVCARRGTPWIAFRAISDRHQDGLIDESILALTTASGGVDPKAAARLVARHPGQIRRLVKLGRDTQKAAAAAAAAGIAACRRLAGDLRP